MIVMSTLISYKKSVIGWLLEVVHGVEVDRWVARSHIASYSTDTPLQVVVTNTNVYCCTALD